MEWSCVQPILCEGPYTSTIFFFYLIVGLCLDQDLSSDLIEQWDVYKCTSFLNMTAPLPLSMYLHPVIHENAKEPGKGVKTGTERKKNKLIVAVQLALRYMQKLFKKTKNKTPLFGGCGEKAVPEVGLQWDCRKLGRSLKLKKKRGIFVMTRLWMGGESELPHSLWELLLRTCLNSATLIGMYEV